MRIDADAAGPRAQPTTTLVAGGYTATVSAVGAALVDLRHDGRPLVCAFPTRPPRPRFRGAVLAPWPNRIRDAAYRYGGEVHQLPVNEPERGCALHGLVLWSEWRLVSVGAADAVFTETIWPQQGYPFTVVVTVEYALDATAGLRTTVTARNEGDVTAPFGTAAHPYVIAGAGGVDDWVLRLPARSVLRADPQRLLPQGQEDVTGTALDFRTGRPLSDVVLDHTFGDLDAGSDGQICAVLTSTLDGGSVRMSWDSGSPWVQVHTTEDPSHEWHRRALALEPMTCPPDAFNSGVDLWELQPGDRRAVSWGLAVGQPDAG